MINKSRHKPAGFSFPRVVMPQNNGPLILHDHRSGPMVYQETRTDLEATRSGIFTGYSLDESSGLFPATGLLKYE